jgi:hypothetical protein
MPRGDRWNLGRRRPNTKVIVSPERRGGIEIGDGLGHNGIQQMTIIRGRSRDNGALLGLSGIQLI